MKPPPPGLPPATSAKWHSRHRGDALGYLRVRSMANPQWHRDIPWLVRWLRRESPPAGDPLRGHYDDAIAAARRYQHLIDRGGVEADADAAWDGVLAPIDAVLEHRHRVHLDRVRHAGVSADHVPLPSGGPDGPGRAGHSDHVDLADLADPWRSCSKGTLPAGWTYPLGRDRVREELLSAGALVDDLSFRAPARSYRDGDAAWVLLGVHHRSDARGGYFTPRGFQAPTLSVTLSAVPAAQRSVLGAALLAQWLPQACAWAAQAPQLGDAWSAGDHGWRLMTDRSGQVDLIED